jgi:CRISPR-associated protein Cas1
MLSFVGVKMKETVYIFSSGELKRKENTLFFISKEGKKAIPVEHVKEIFVFGEVDINKKLLEFLTQKEIILSYFNHYGYYMGSFYPREHYNSGFMILKQAAFYMDDTKRLTIAKKIVEGAALNCIKIMNYYNRRGKSLEEPIQQTRQLIEELSGKTDIEQSMSVEGKLKKIYYQSFNTIIINPDFAFTKRSKRPPADHINSLISFANSIIYTYVLGEIYQTHLDPRIGFLHSTNFRRFSLNLDIAEIFKPVIGDRTIFQCLNKKIISTGDFENKLNGLILKEAGRRKFLEQLEEKLKQTIKHSTLDKEVSYRRLIRLELYKLEKHLMEEGPYRPFVMEW